MIAQGKAGLQQHLLSSLAGFPWGSRGRLFCFLGRFCGLISLHNFLRWPGLLRTRILACRVVFTRIQIRLYVLLRRRSLEDFLHDIHREIVELLETNTTLSHV